MGFKAEELINPGKTVFGLIEILGPLFWNLRLQIPT